MSKPMHFQPACSAGIVQPPRPQNKSTRVGMVQAAGATAVRSEALQVLHRVAACALKLPHLRQRTVLVRAFASRRRFVALKRFLDRFAMCPSGLVAADGWKLEEP